jgi:O-antigen/teichoic acid export membrane protein
MGIGQAKIILRVAVVGVAADLGLSIWLVHPLGIAGVFWGTVGGSLIMVPWLISAVGRQLSVGTGEFLRASVFPLAAPIIVEVIVCAVVVNLGFSPALSLLVGAVAGGSAYVACAWRWALRPNEVQELWRTLTRSRHPG